MYELFWNILLPYILWWELYWRRSVQKVCLFDTEYFSYYNETHEAIISQTADSPRISNTHLLISSEGSLVGQYTKLHLFSNNIPGVAINEGDYVNAGEDITPPITSPAGNIGLAIVSFTVFDTL